jgi:hypothetical protein
MRAIRLLVQCETALEKTETGLQIALPGSKFQYYRPVFKDFEDILQRLKTRLLSFTNVPDEVRQMALNQLDDYIPPPPPESPPLSPSSQRIAPSIGHLAPTIMTNRLMTTMLHQTPMTPTMNRTSLNKHHTYWGEQDKTKGMDAYPSSSTLYIMYGTINKHNVGLQQQMN